MPPGGSGGKPAFIHSKLDDAGLDVYEFRIYGRIARRGNGCHESITSMAEGCGISERTIHRAVDSLIERRMIRCEKRPGQTTIYHLTSPSEWVEPPHEMRGSTAGDAGVEDATTAPQAEGYRTTGRGTTAPQADPIYKGSPRKVLQEGTTQEETESNTEPFLPDPPEEPSVGLQKVPPSESENLPADPVEVYKQITGNGCAIYFQELIRKDVGTDPEKVAFWGAVCEVWRDTEKWNDRQVRKMLDDFKSQLARSKKTNGKSRPDGESPKETYLRLLRVAGGA